MSKFTMKLREKSAALIAIAMVLVLLAFVGVAMGFRIPLISRITDALGFG